MKKTCIAIITARGGSKRIPKKNIKDFCGKPIIAYSIKAAVDSGIFDEIMVSTDSEEIAEIAKTYGAKVPFYRSEKTAGDFATTADVILEVLSEYEKRGKTFDYAACIYPTAPFITAEKLRQGYHLLEESEETMVMPVTAFSYPPQRSHIIKNGKLEMKWKENFSKRSQDFETFYHDCGQFYFYNVKRYIEEKGVITEGVVPIIVDEMEVQDIDNETDWKIAEMKYGLMNHQNTRED